MEEQQNQLLSELEYRNQMQQLQELQELQAQHQQQQQQGLSQLLSQNPHFLELQEQQQYQSGRENSLLAYLRDDFLLQRHQQMLQDQIQQQLQERLSRESHQHEQEDLVLGMLQACGNLRGILPTEAVSFISSLRQGEIVNQQPLSDQSPAQSNPPPVGHSPVLSENLLNNSIKQRADSPSTHQDHTYGQTYVNSPKKRTLSDVSDMNAGGGSPDTPKRVKKTKLAINSPKVKLSSSIDRASDSLMGNQTTIDKDEEHDEKVAKQASPKIAAEKKKKKEKEKEREKVSPEKKGATRASNVEIPLARKEGKQKGGSVITQEDKKASRKNGHGDVGIKLSGQEESVINFLCTRGKKNGKEQLSVSNGAHHADEKKNGEEAKVDAALYDDEAVDIVLNFQRCVVPDSEVQQAEKWSKEKQPPESIPVISPVLKVDFPSLPIEPQVNDLEAVCMGTVDTPQLATEDAMGGKSESILMTPSPTLIGANESKDEDVIKFIGTKKKVFKPKKCVMGQDVWWPSDECIRKERQKLGIKRDEEDTDEDDEASVDSVSGISFVKAGIESMKRRLMTSVEPGVLEKLPHCKLYDNFCKDTKKKLFCCQTTEIFPFEHMICCSVCSTWRHAQCGGHYKRYTSESVDPSNLLFEPVCDQCYLEKDFVESNPVASARLERQRIEHLRRYNATNAVMRQVAFAKHSGQYKWPLGCVSTSHISGHVRSVQSRHEKAEKQWSEMATRLGNGQELKPRERQRVRKRELERLLAHVEDAGKSIIHNPGLFSPLSVS